MRTDPRPTDHDWDARLAYWRRRLGRLRLDAEPIADQLDRYRGVTWTLTGVAAGVAAIFLALFTAFGRPDVGAVLVAVLFAPVVAIAWADHAALRRRAAAFERERERSGRSGAVRTRTPGEEGGLPPAS